MIKTLTIAMLLKATDQASGPVKGLSAVIERMGAKGVAVVGSLAAKLNRIGVEAEAAARKVKPLTDKLDKIGDYGKKVSEYTLIPGGVMAGAMGYTVKDFADLEAARTSLAVAMMKKGGVLDAAEYGKLSGLAEQLGKDYKGSAMQMYQMFRVLMEQGIAAPKILDGIGKSVADFATVTGESYEGAAFKIAKFHDSLAVAPKDMMEMTNMMSKARFAFGLDSQELYTAMPYMTSGLKALRLQGLGATETVLRLAGVMAQSGIPASEIGTSIEQALNRMSDFTLRMQKQSKAMKEIRGILSGTGIEMQFWDKKGNFAGVENMIAQFEKLNKLSPQKMMEVGKYLFGDVGKRFVTVWGEKGVKGWEESGRRMSEQADQAERVAKNQTTMDFKWNSMTGTLKNLRGEIGGAVANATMLKRVVDGLNDTFGGIAKWMRQSPRISTGLAGIAVGAVSLLLGVGVIGAGIAGIAKFAAFAIGGWVRGLVLLKAVLIGVRGVMLGMTLTGGLLAAAFVSVGAAIYQVIKHWDTLKQPGFLKDLWGFITFKDPTKEYDRPTEQRRYAVAQAGGGDMHFSPQITIRGNADKSHIEQALLTSREDFERNFDRMMTQRTRRAF